MNFKNASILFFIVIAISACSFKISSPSFEEIRITETELIKPYISYNKENEVFEEILCEALKLSKMPNDYAKIVFIDNSFPVISSGISTEIYIYLKILFIILIVI